MPTAACSNSEIWADLAGGAEPVQAPQLVPDAARCAWTSPAALAALKSYVENDPRLKLDVKSEAAYYADQSSLTSDLIQKLGWPLAIAMALGALAGALNTMYQLGRRPRLGDRDLARDRLRRLLRLCRHASSNCSSSPRSAD